MADKTPLEQVQQRNEETARNLEDAHEQSLGDHSHNREQQNVDVTTDAPGSIGKSGQAPNPRTHPNHRL